MSVVLQRGDKIHLAFGVRSGLSPDEFAKESTKLHGEYAAAYASMGVEIVISTGSETIVQPVVVAVIRNNA